MLGTGTSALEHSRSAPSGPGSYPGKAKMSHMALLLTPGHHCPYSSLCVDLSLLGCTAPLTTPSSPRSLPEKLYRSSERLQVPGLGSEKKDPNQKTWPWVWPFSHLLLCLRPPCPAAEDSGGSCGPSKHDHSLFPRTPGISQDCVGHIQSMGSPSLLTHDITLHYEFGVQEQCWDFQ